MKLAVAQAVLGLLILGSFVVFLTYLAPGYNSQEIIDPDGNVIGNILGLEKANPLLGGWTLVYAVLGLAVFGSGIAQCLQARRDAAGASQETGQRRWAVVQMALGALVVASLVVFAIWAEPHVDWTPRTVFREDGARAIVVRHNPRWVAVNISWKVASFSLGLAVLACGVAQLVRARKLR